MLTACLLAASLFRASPLTVESGAEWRVTFARDGASVSAADCAPARIVATGALERTEWTHPKVRVAIERTPVDAGFDYVAEVTPLADDVVEVDVPVRFRFDAASVDRLVMPQSGSHGPGVAFNARFFEPQEQPVRWTFRPQGSAGLRRLWGSGTRSDATLDAPVPVSVTDEGRMWLTPEERAAVTARPLRVNRAPLPDTADRVLVDSPNGPLLACRNIGSGALWRYGTGTPSGDGAAARAALGALVRGLVGRRAPGRTKIAVLDLDRGPSHAFFSELSPASLVGLVYERASADIVFEKIVTLDELEAALSREDQVLILNPYGEGFPVREADGLGAVLDRLQAWMARGGHWIETGGCSFYGALVPDFNAVFEEAYPKAFMDYFHLTRKDGTACAVYGVQPRGDEAPWRKTDRFVRGGVGCGRDAQGAWARHWFSPYVRKGETRRLPPVRILEGLSDAACIRRYGEANRLDRPLAAKVPAETLERLRTAPMLFVGGNPTAADCREMVGSLPVPTLFHITSYLKGGFDKQYPDHLPPRAAFGDGAAFRGLIDALHEKGHLFSPYTNPTWWCDSPRGPTFAAAGEEPLMVGRNGRKVFEAYGANTGWTTTLWHPAVQTANREVVRAFREDYPADLLFQDQCGSRPGGFDFNPASPSPDAYVEGLLSMVEEDAARLPIATEDAWDQCANYETAVFGMAWRTVPYEAAPSFHRVSFKDRFDPRTWEYDPCALRLMHGRTLFWMHDLGQSVSNTRVLAWMLALGYNLNAVTTPSAWRDDDGARTWFAWLADIQKHVIARYSDLPLDDFRHDRGPLFARHDVDPRSQTDDGVVVARYGEVRVVVNLGDVPRRVEGEELAAYGWSVKGPGVRAAFLKGERPFVMIGGVRREGPLSADAAPEPQPARRAGKVALIDLPPDVQPAWTRIPVSAWASALGPSCVRLRTVAEIERALASDEVAAIVNPYGESVPVAGPDGWPRMAGLIRGYLERGGAWWETAGCPFAFATWQEGTSWKRRPLWSAGLRALGLSAVQGEVADPPQRLVLTEDGRRHFPSAWFGTEAWAVVNRPLSERPGAAVVPLVRTRSGAIWLGYHPVGKGRLYRVGGFNPPPELLLRLVRRETAAGDYAVSILGDTHYDAEPESVFHAHYDESNPWAKVQHEEFRRNGEMWRGRCRRLLAASGRLAKEGPTDLVLQLGDLVQGDCDDAETHRRMLAEGCGLVREAYPAGLPFLTVVGNHDVRGKGAREAYFAFAEPYLSEQLGMPVRYPVMSFRKGGDLWILCDFETRDLQPLIDELERASDARHVFVVTHGPFTAPEAAFPAWRLGGAQACDALRPKLYEALSRRHAVVLSGHTHTTAFYRHENRWGGFSEYTANSVWKTEDLATDRPLAETPEAYGSWARENLSERYLADFERAAPEFRPGLVAYFMNRAAGHSRLVVSDSGVTVEFYPGAADVPARTFRMK